MRNIRFEPGEATFHPHEPEYEFLSMIADEEFDKPNYISTILDDWLSWEDGFLRIELDDDEVELMNEYAGKIQSK